MEDIRVCIVPPSSKHHPATFNLVGILKALISKENVFVLGYRSFIAKAPRFAKFGIYALDELSISIKLMRLLPKVDIIFIFQANHFFPALIGRLSRKKVVLFVGGSPIVDSFYREQIRPSLLNKILYVSNVLLADVCNALSQKIVTISPSMVNSTNLARYREKVSFASIFSGILHMPLFNIQKQYGKRELIVGYVGRFEKVKGITNLVGAIPQILKQLDNAQIEIIGKGTLSRDIKLQLEKYCTSNAVKILGWVPYIMLPKYYNDFKLLVLPSYSEGVPSVTLEAMSCGTPVLATPVGGIPDIIKDGETGFLLESNDPDHIADKIVELLNKPELLEKVSKNAYKWVKENFSKEKTLEAWRKIFGELGLL
jgi:glycosyltransferase involved in cell wall biosynthesis